MAADAGITQGLIYVWWPNSLSTQDDIWQLVQHFYLNDSKSQRHDEGEESQLMAHGLQARWQLCAGVV